MAKRKRKVSVLRLIIILLIVLLLIIGGFFIYNYIKDLLAVEDKYLANDEPTVLIRNEDDEYVEFTRGTKLQVKVKPTVIDEVEYHQFKYEDKKYYVLEDNLVTDYRDCVLEKNRYVLKNSILSDEIDSYIIKGYVKKSDLVEITGYHELLSDGSVDYYFVNNTGYIESSKLAKEYYDTSLDSSIYTDVDYGSGGDPTLIDYYHKEELSFSNNKMPEVVQGLYINAEAVCIVDRYIELAENSNINAFVVDIKDCYVDTQLAYDSKVMKEYAPSTDNIPNTFEEYKEAIKKIKDAGYYVIGRITAFKDDAFARDNIEESLVYEDGEFYHYNLVDWPSIYSRKMWEYNVALASEAVKEMGFNEIQFDYCRSPERIDDDVLKRNKYNETPSQAITNFLRYATEQLHKLGVYVSADVFGEISGWNDYEYSGFVSGYGQFWPAISNAVDAISSMPYPDHFSNYAYDVYEPWSNPYDIIYAWGKATKFSQEKTYDPAKCRTWIMVQDSEPYDVEYDEYMILDQIEALKDADVYDGFLTWNAASSLWFYGLLVDNLD